MCEQGGEDMNRMIKYAGAVLMYRVAGSSRVPYIPDHRVEEFKTKGSAIITSNIETLNDVVSILMADRFK